MTESRITLLYKSKGPDMTEHVIQLAHFVVGQLASTQHSV